MAQPPRGIEVQAPKNDYTTDESTKKFQSCMKYITEQPQILKRTVCWWTAPDPEKKWQSCMKYIDEQPQILRRSLRVAVEWYEVNSISSVCCTMAHTAKNGTEAWAKNVIHVQFLFVKIPQN